MQKLLRSLPLRPASALPLAILALAPGMAAAPAPAATVARADADLSAINHAIRAMGTLQAHFVQTDPAGGVKTGTLLLKQPGHVRFDYGDNDLLIVADGSSLYMVDYEVSQVQRWPIRNSPLGALLDPSRDLTKYGKIVDTGDPRIVSAEVRDPDHPEYGALTLVFTRQASAPSGLQLYGWVAKDAQGNRTSIRLSDLVYGKPIADSAFRWRDPRPNQKGPRG